MTKLKFNKKDHKYTYGDKELESVTTFIGRFFEKFDAKAIARKLAKFKSNKEQKRGVRYWLREWKKSSTIGTRIHEEIEKSLLAGEYNFSHKRAGLALAWIDKHLDTLGDAVVLSPEMKIFDVDLELAGTIDLAVFGQKNRVWLFDWKTNKAITKKGHKGKKAKEPIEDMDDCNYNKYILQLSLYAYILSLKGYDVQECTIVHLKQDAVVPYVFSPHDYFDKIRDMINYKRDNNEKN